jgi:CBS domain containing-hemolysin-like protein
MIEFLAAIAFCLLMEGLFTGAEMALVSADPHKLTEKARSGDRGAQIALELLEKPERTISTTLTGTNLFVVLSTIIATSHFLPGFGSRAELMAVVTITPLVILFGEIVPKSFVQPRADAMAGGAARFVRYAGVALYPVVSVASFLARLLSRPFGGVPPIRGMVTREELRLVLQTRSESDVEPHERVMVRRAFRFSEKKVSDIFRPLAQVVALPEDATCREAAELASRSGYSRYPVYRERIDRVVGYLHVLDAVGHPPESPIAPLMRKAFFVPELMPIDELMRSLQAEKTPFAMAVDEFGGVTGIVTAEDVVEEIVGEIEDEYDRRTEYLKKISPSEFIVRGSMEIRRFEEEVGVPLPPGDYSTVGGMLISLAEKIPSIGDSFSIPGAEFTVVNATDRAVKEIRVALKSEAKAEKIGEKEGEEPQETPRKEKE